MKNINMNLNQISKALRELGWELDVHHERNYTEVSTLDGVRREVNPKGGSTVVVASNESLGVTEIESAICSNKDNYNKKIGTRVALGRLIKRLNIANQLDNLLCSKS